jgi:hypothetical protein
MTPQDTRLQDLLAALTRAHVGAKEPDAQTLNAKTSAREPEVVYLVVQRAPMSFDPVGAGDSSGERWPKPYGKSTGDTAMIRGTSSSTTPPPSGPWRSSK